MRGDHLVPYGVRMVFNEELAHLLQKRKEELDISDYALADLSRTPRTSIRRHLTDPESMRFGILRRVLTALGLTLADVEQIDDVRSARSEVA